MAILIFFFLLLCVALPLGQVVRIPLSLSVLFTPMDVVVGAGSTIWIVSKLFQKPYHFTAQAKGFIVVIAIFVLSLIVNAFFLPKDAAVAAALYIVRWTLYTTLFFIAYSLSPQKKKTILLFLTIGATTLLILGFLQFFLYPALRNLLYAGWDEHFYRMFGTFFDPNFFGLFLVCFFLFLLHFALLQTKNRWMFLLLLLPTFVAIILTYSRTAFLTLGIGLLAYFWQNTYWKKIGIGLLGMVLVAVLIIGIVGRRAEGNDVLRLTSTGARVGDAKNALTIFLDNPIIGVGFNAYRYAQYRHHFMPGSTTQEDHGASGADSSLLFVLATSGIIGFGAYLYFLWTHVDALRKKKSMLGLATLIVVVVGSTFVDGLFYPSIMVWLWVVLGVTESGEW